ncbi:hypothetical protein [Scytonema millei]|nr:hypothetical protein [Scytonema millei]
MEGEKKAEAAIQNSRIQNSPISVGAGFGQKFIVTSREYAC